MKRKLLSLSLAAPLVLAACASAPQAPPPATVPVAAVQAVLASTTATSQPAGMSDIGAIIAQRTTKQSTAKKPMNAADLPAGHPPLPGVPQLPAGHPDISQMQAAQGGKPAATQSTGNGSLTVRAVQATAGGVKVGQLPVVIEFRQGEQVLDKSDAKLDAQGTLRVDEIPLALGVTPVVRVTYNGVEYTATGSVIDVANADQQLQVQVYETTEDAPKWSVSMQHVMLEPSVDGVRVMEMLSITNPTDRAWIGKPSADNKRTTLTLALPQGAKDVQFSGGFHDCCVKVVEGKIVDSMALLPGTAQYRLVYTLPVSDGKAALALTTAAAVKHFMVFLPDDGSKVDAQGIGDVGVADMGGGKTRFFKAADLPAGADLKLSISGIKATASAYGKTTGGKAGGSAQTAKLVAGVGGLAIFLVGGMLVMFKAPRSRKA
jgi:hypothetical protein